MDNGVFYTSALSMLPASVKDNTTRRGRAAETKKGKLF